MYTEEDYKLKSGKVTLRMIVGLEDGRYLGIGLQTMQYGNTYLDGTFQQVSYGFITDYKGEHLDDVKAALSALRTAMATKYGIEWQDEPEEPVNNEPIVEPNAQEE